MGEAFLAGQRESIGGRKNLTSGIVTTPNNNSFTVEDLGFTPTHVRVSIYSNSRYIVGSGTLLCAFYDNGATKNCYGAGGDGDTDIDNSSIYIKAEDGKFTVYNYLERFKSTWQYYYEAWEE